MSSGIIAPATHVAQADVSTEKTTSSEANERLQRTISVIIGPGGAPVNGVPKRVPRTSRGFPRHATAGEGMVGMAGFEPAAPRPPVWCASQAALHPEAVKNPESENLRIRGFENLTTMSACGARLVRHASIF